ncbi:MAG: NAD(P)-dependent oxidoreductase [Anaerolineae bacterium]|nr:NAD(P)-dependent oxidoreductase [Anaerolineae bacterium]
MKILLTGGTGNVGRAAVTRLVQNGHALRVIGRRPIEELDAKLLEGAEYVQCDVNDYAALREQVRGMEGIVHLAAIAFPGGGPSQEVFRINCSGTYNVYQAAAEEGIKKISCASSINALGFNYGLVPFDIHYFPVDEQHPVWTTDAYSFSKQVTEAIGDYFWRREGISSINLRLPGVYEMREDRPHRWIEFSTRFRQALEELLAQPEAERRARIERAVAKYDATRPDRAGFFPDVDMRERWRALRDDRDLGLLFGGFGRSNFWASIDARDSAQALEKGLTAQYEGSHPIFVNDSENGAGIDSEMLVQLFFPQVRGRAHPLQGRETLVSIDKARALIGYEPEYHISALMGF